MLENVIVLKQVLETATDTPSTNDPEPTMPAPETLGAQFKNRYQICFPLYSPLFSHKAAILFLIVKIMI